MRLAPDERERLLGRYGRRFATGETLFREGEPATEADLERALIEIRRILEMAEAISLV